MTEHFVSRYAHLWKWVSRALGPIILVAILFRLDFSDTIESIAQAKIIPLVLAYLILLPAIFLRSLRWRFLLISQEINLSYWESFSVYAFSIFVGTLTPGRIGEFIKALYLKQKGNSFGASFFSVFFDRVLDVFILLIFACGALFSFDLYRIEPSLTIVFILFGIVLTSTVLWFFTRGYGFKISLQFLRIIMPQRIEDRVLKGFQDFCEGLWKIKPGIFVMAIALSIFAWIVNYYAIYLCGGALGFDITFLQMSCIAAVCALVTLVPISVMGIGTRDAALILMLGKYGISEGCSVAFSTLILSMLVFNGLICSFSLLTPAVKFDWRSQIDQAKT